MSRFVIAFANWGRAKSVDPVRRSMQVTRDGLLKKGLPVVLELCEIDEGDSGYSDHTLINSTFTGWNKYNMEYREPILTHGCTLDTVHVNGGAFGVKHQSPPRKVVDGTSHDLIKYDPGVTFIGGHFPAGCHNGERPPAIKEQLCDGYSSMLKVWKDRMTVHHERDQHVVWGADVNWRHFPKLFPHEVQIDHDGPDYLRALPANGYALKVRDKGKIDNFIEPGLHDCHWAIIEFVKEA